MQKLLTAEQHWKVATVYEMAAADQLGVPPQQRAAFARKAKWFRMLARIAAKKEAAVVLKEVRSLEPRHGIVSDEQRPSNEGWRPKAKYQTLAERLKTARAAHPTA
jgi:hypothetical protein